MACTLCHFEIPTTLCEVCRYLTEGIPPQLPRVCDYCGAPIASSTDSTEGETFCQLCKALLEVVSGSEGLVRAHAEWTQENIRLARRKRELLEQEGPPAF